MCSCLCWCWAPVLLGQQGADTMLCSLQHLSFQYPTPPYPPEGQPAVYPCRFLLALLNLQLEPSIPGSRCTDPCTSSACSAGISGPKVCHEESPMSREAAAFTSPFLMHSPLLACCIRQSLPPSGHSMPCVKQECGVLSWELSALETKPIKPKWVSRSREMNPATCWVSCGNHFLQVRSSSNDLAEQAPKAGLNSALGFQHWCDLHSKLVQVTVAYKC